MKRFKNQEYTTMSPTTHELTLNTRLYNNGTNVRVSGSWHSTTFDGSTSQLQITQGAGGNTTQTNLTSVKFITHAGATGDWIVYAYKLITS